jgi:hypothetical protein
MTTTTNKPSNERKVIAALDTAQEATVDGVAAAAGIGRAPAGADQERLRGVGQTRCQPRLMRPGPGDRR